MIHSLETYSTYRDSGVPWMGEVPAHWEVRRLRHLIEGKLTYGANAAAEYTDPTWPRYLRITDFSKNGGLRKDTFRSLPPEMAKDYLVKPGDVLLARSGATVGKAFLVAEEAGIACHAGYLIRARPNRSLLHPAFFFAFTQSTSFAGWKDETFIIATIQNIGADKYADLRVPIPPFPEQTAIVRFLDHAERRIRRHIRAKQKLIALLEEQKQAIIHQAVTGQIDVRTGRPYPTYKPSGVEWLGNVPEHWEGLTLKRWVSTKITDGPHETPLFQVTGIPFMSAESMVGGRLDFGRRRGFISYEQHKIYCRKCRPQRDDIFMCKSGATTGKVAIVETDDDFSVWSPLALIRVDPDRVLPRLLFVVLSTHYVQRQVQDTWSYGTQPNLSMAAMERLFVVLPPIDEQHQILTYMDRALKEPFQDISRAHRQIKLLQEFRSRLIADVVTGKLDVREVAATLPEVDPLTTDDELDEPIEADSEAHSDGLEAIPEEVEA